MIKKIKILQYPNMTCARFETRVQNPGKDKGNRVIHYIYEDKDLPGAFWHEMHYLTRETDMAPVRTHEHYVSERVYWGKVRMVKHREWCMAETWGAIALSIEKIMSVRRFGEGPRKENSR